MSAATFEHKPCEPGCRAFSDMWRGDCGCPVGFETVTCEACLQPALRRAVTVKRLVGSEWLWTCDACRRAQ